MPFFILSIRQHVCQLIHPNTPKDNGHVEQKNGDKIRALVGYYSYTTQEQADLLNKIYQIDDLFQNHFIPSLR